MDIKTLIPSIERIFWVVLIVSAIYGTVAGTNYVRDHEVYRQTAVRCEGDKSILGQEIEQLNAEINFKDGKVEELKAQPLR